MSTNRRPNKSYSPELKLDAVQKVLSGESVINVAKKLDVVDPDYIYKWIEKYTIYGEVGLKRKVRNHPQLDKDYVIQELEMENELLKKYLQILHKEGKQSNSK
ncbi:transposase [Alkalihalophilus marmarensis]|jgi:transposase-like protein|uniref:transposase n=1 Tax=Alkalihalophilus marmarensis TaxID=521377 RepID=UPI00203C91C6|nr:transposase [Alkalihalophilus marmarensis]MCM3490004.1 transposase [Alkalihalophilus marmarensis]